MIVNLDTVWNSLVYSLCDSILHLDSTRHPAVAKRFSEYRIWKVTNFFVGYPIGYTKSWYCNMI